MSELSGPTKLVLDYLIRADRDGERPTVREIQEGAGLSSTSVADYHLNRLQALGYIKRDRGKARSIRLLKGHAGDIVMVFRGEDAELVRERLGDRPADSLIAFLRKAREKVG